MQLNDHIERWAQTTPEALAVIFGDQKITFSDLTDSICQATESLAHRFKVQPGDRVTYLGLNHPNMLVILFACERLGAIFTPFNSRLAPAEYAFLMDDADPKVALIDDAFYDMIDALPESKNRLAAPQALYEKPAKTTVPLAHIDQGEPLLLVYTSGTTGHPKGVLLSRRAVMANVENCQHLYRFQPGQKIQITIPLFHVGGLCIMLLPALTHGATILLHARFDPLATLIDVEHQRPTSSIYVPAQMAAMMSLPEWKSCDLSSFDYVVAGSSLIPVGQIETFHARGIPVSQLYGATETGPAALGLEISQAQNKVGSAGTPVKLCSIEIRDENRTLQPQGQHGDLWVKGDNILSGYWRNPEETAKVLIDGWYNTGDIGFEDADGFYWIVDRSKEVIISGGENIYPAEIEAASLEHPEIEAIAVVGQAHPRWGETPVAVVEVSPGAQISLETYQAFLHDRLARFKHPKGLMIVDQLPRNGMGKIEKSVLRQHVNG